MALWLLASCHLPAGDGDRHRGAEPSDSSSGACVATDPSDEICDGLDNDCDGTVDLSDQPQHYLDADGDGCSEVADSYSVCDGPPAIVMTLECDDSDPWASGSMLEICSDGVDNDCDGKIDEGGCASWVLVGDDPARRLGHVLVDPLDPANWSVRSSDRTQGLVGVPGDRSFTEAWQSETLRPTAHATLSGAPVFAATTESSVQLYEVAGAEPVEILDRSTELWAGAYIAQTPGGLVLAVETDAYTTLLFDDPQDDPEAPLPASAARATLNTLPKEGGFGHGDVMFLPDPGGDGIPELVVSIAQTHVDAWGSSNALVFDGAQTGTVAAEDADAIIVNPAGTYGAAPRPAGDLDGDGNVDLAVGAYYVRPFASFIDGREPYIQFGSPCCGVSLDDDEYVDLVSPSEVHDSALAILYGPVAPGVYDPAVADARIPMQYASDNELELIGADVDRDGRAELLMAWPDYLTQRGTDTGPWGAGILAAFGTDAWVE